MINELLNTSINCRSDISESIHSSYQHINNVDVYEKWMDYGFKDDYSNVNLIAVDGSLNCSRFVIGDVYALSSHVLYNNYEKTEYLKSLNEVVFIPSSQDTYSKVINKQMNVMELKCILDGLNTKDIDYVLLDGDLHSTLNHIAAGVRTSMMNEDYIKSLTEDISIDCGDDDYELPTIHEILENIPDSRNNSKYDYLMYCLMIEQLCIIYGILNKFSHKIISISKTSHGHSLYNYDLSDRAIIEIFTSNSGYSKEYKNDDNRFRIHTPFDVKYSEYPLYDEFLSKVVFTNRFVRLTDMASPLKVQLAYDASEDEFLDVLSMLKSISLTSTGYPVILKKVHDDVKISNKNMNNIIRNMGLNNFKQERNVV